MKTSIKNLFLVLACMGLTTMPMLAQTLTTLYTFTATDLSTGTNSDGANPQAGLILSGNTLYGTTYEGGSSGLGAVFRVNTDGTDFTNLHSFTVLSSSYPYTNSDGALPYAGVILSGTTLYGTSFNGGSSGFGTVFKVNNDGTDFTNLHNFTAGSDGANPYAALILSGNTLYGTASSGGSTFEGVVFAVSTNGTGFTNLYNFTFMHHNNTIGVNTNSDGADPQAGLILSGNTLYGTTYKGGSFGNGTVFRVNTDGTDFTNLHSFTVLSSSYPYTNSDGANPQAGLILSGNTLYGTAPNGGSSGVGTMFAVNTDGTGFTNLHTFTGIYGYGPPNNDGATPIAGLIISGSTLYGTASNGGNPGNGTLFAINTNGTGFTNLYNFTGGSDGGFPIAGLTISGNTLYGTTPLVDGDNNGTVFSFSLGSVTVSAPQLTILHSETNVILTWPTNATGFTLEFATNLVSPIVWQTNSTAQFIISGQNIVTNPITGTQKFFRLSQ